MSNIVTDICQAVAKTLDDLKNFWYQRCDGLKFEQKDKLADPNAPCQAICFGCAAAGGGQCTYKAGHPGKHWCPNCSKNF